MTSTISSSTPAAAHLALIVLRDKGVPAMREMCSRLGVLERVHFLPPVPHDSLVSLIREADVAVHPLERYPNGDMAMPNKLFEYLHFARRTRANLSERGSASSGRGKLKNLGARTVRPTDGKRRSTVAPVTET